MTLDDFTADAIRTGETRIFVRQHESGPPILLLHGFPQTHVMWRGVAPLLARGFTVVCADLRGYGRSGCPASAPDHAPYAKRAMAHDMVAVRRRLPLGTISGGGGYIASGVIARDLGLKLWWHPVDARQSLKRLADRESA